MDGSDTEQHEPVAAEITSPDELQTALRTILLSADSNGVDVRGGWVIDADADTAWDVEITGLSQATVARIRDTEEPAAAVVRVVAAQEGVDVTDLPPLFDAVEPDILEPIHRSDAGDGQRVSFNYYGYRITLTSDGPIVIED